MGETSVRSPASSAPPARFVSRLPDVVVPAGDEQRRQLVPVERGGEHEEGLLEQRLHALHVVEAREVMQHRAGRRGQAVLHLQHVRVVLEGGQQQPQHRERLVRQVALLARQLRLQVAAQVRGVLAPEEEGKYKSTELNSGT